MIYSSALAERLHIFRVKDSALSFFMDSKSINVMFFLILLVWKWRHERRAPSLDCLDEKRYCSSQSWTRKFYFMTIFMAIFFGNSSKCSLWLVILQWGTKTVFTASGVDTAAQNVTWKNSYLIHLFSLCIRDACLCCVIDPQLLRTKEADDEQLYVFAPVVMSTNLCAQGTSC